MRSALTEKRVEHEHPCPSFCGRREVCSFPYKIRSLRPDQYAWLHDTVTSITRVEQRGESCDESTHHSLDDIGEIITSSDEQCALLSVGRADLVDPGEDQGTGSFLRPVSDEYQSRWARQIRGGLTPTVHSQYRAKCPLISV
jgi:hypothetical protein